MATLSGWSIINAFQICQLDTDIWENENADAIEDIDDEIYGWSADFSASLAYAGGFSGNPGANNNKRREFWEWYLNQAAEEAYKSVCQK
nr:Imm5 family immunity protein [Hahella sp. HN01]